MNYLHNVPVADKGVHLVVTLRSDAVNHIHRLDLAAYVRDAVQSWCKGGDPEDSMFDAGDKATVNLVTSKHILTQPCEGEP